MKASVAWSRYVKGLDARKRIRMNDLVRQMVSDTATVDLRVAREYVMFIEDGVVLPMPIEEE